MRIRCALSQSTFGGGLEPNRNGKIMHGYAPYEQQHCRSFTSEATTHAVFAVQDMNYDGLSCWDATD